MHREALTQTKCLHDNTLTRKTRISMQLYAHNAISELAILWRRLEQRILFRSRLAQSDRVDSL
jgi:hypothetical protein